MNVPLEDGQFIDPISAPTLASPVLKWEASVIAATKLRPEMQLQHARVCIARLRNCAACDRMRPDVSGYAGWGLTGAADSFGDSMDIIGDGDYTSWWLGVRYERQLGRRNDRAKLEQTQLTLSQEVAAMENVRENIYGQLHDAYQSVESAWEVIQLSRDQLSAAEEVLRARREMYLLGVTRLEDSLRAVSAHGKAKAAERRAVADYNRSLVKWEYAKGTVYDYSSVSVLDESDQYDSPAHTNAGTEVELIQPDELSETRNPP